MPRTSRAGIPVAPATVEAVEAVEADAARLDQWERRTRPLIIAAALIPLIGVSTGTEHFGPLGAAIEIACWVVFLVDLIVHMRLHPQYLKTGMGRFDLVVVVLTSPWYLLPGVDGGEFVTLLRLARLARVMIIGLKTPMLKRTFERLGKPFIYVGIMTLVCAAIVVRAEDHKHGFETYGDALWWAVVTITTVGYGDLVPESRVGRVTATILMLSGVALLGTVAASLASLFRLEDKADEEAEEEAAEDLDGAMLPVPPVTAVPPLTPTAPADPDVPDTPVAAADRAVAVDVAAELRALREEVAALRAELAARRPDPR